MYIDLMENTTIRFICNICDTRNEINISNFHRELAHCKNCKSTPRFRGIIYHLSKALFGESLLLKCFPINKKIRGLEMSGWETYACVLEEKFSYVNTFYDRNPRFDVTSGDYKCYQDLDFVISTDVFEHIMPPVQAAFDNVFSMLKERGVFVFSVPYIDGAETLEHFQNINKFQLYDFFGRKVLVNETKTGKFEVFDNLIFHGGEGCTLEMRVFAEKSIIMCLQRAGFKSIEIQNQPILEYGYYWPAKIERQELGLPSLGYLITAMKTL